MFQDIQEELSPLVRRMNQLIELNESREKFLENLIGYQQKLKMTFDRKAKNVLFQPGHLVLIWDARREDKGKHGEFDPLWFGPFRIAKSKENNTLILENLDGELLQLPVNG